MTNDTTREAMLGTVAESVAKLDGMDGVYIERLDAGRQEIIASALGAGLTEVGPRGPFRGSVAAQAIETCVCIARSRTKAVPYSAGLDSLFRP
jgi:hypothetical protein